MTHPEDQLDPRLFEALTALGWTVPVSEHEVAAAEVRVELTPVELPPELNQLPELPSDLEQDHRLERGPDLGL